MEVKAKRSRKAKGSPRSSGTRRPLSSSPGERINAALGPLVRPVAGLTLDPNNARAHDDAQVKMIADSLARGRLP